MRPSIYLWQKAPCVRLLLPLAAGIWLEWEARLTLRFPIICVITSLIFILLYSLHPLAVKFRWRVINGIFLQLLLVSLGAILVFLKDIRNHPAWPGKDIPEQSFLLLTLDEPPVEKANSFKVLASMDVYYTGSEFKRTKAKLILYLKKEEGIKNLHYGTQLICFKAPGMIPKNRNPGGFDFSLYCLFNGITHQVFLTGRDYIITNPEKKQFFRQFIFASRKRIVSLVQENITGRKEQGLAEALLIGYKDDLDRSLVQSYSNTGVIHIIAISGLHLGLVYAILLFLTLPLKKTCIIRLILILSALWLFSIMAGGQPSVLRSAVMFSFIAAAEVLKRRTYIFNTLALSAFVLLCMNPFWLWDAGFQLSYTAVLSIVLFFQPVYTWFYFPNQLLDFVWKLMAVTISAQLLTLPVSLYHFHQLPVLFILSNVVAVPLSSLILTGEIILCLVSFIEPFAKFLGSLLAHMIQMMNTYVERLATVSFSVWDGLYISHVQAYALFGLIFGLCFWLMHQRKSYLLMTGFSCLVFVSLRSFHIIKGMQQKQLIVFNIPRLQAIELINGRQALFFGDSVAWKDPNSFSYQIYPSQILYRISKTTEAPVPAGIQIHGKTILFADSTGFFAFENNPGQIDLLIISIHSKIDLKQLIGSFTIKQVVIDSSNPPWKARRWDMECRTLGIPSHVVSENGAFVMKL